jgi:hypothetical protein
VSYSVGDDSRTMYQVCIRVYDVEKIWDVYNVASTIDLQTGVIWISNDSFTSMGYVSKIDDSAKFSGLVNGYTQIVAIYYEG